MTEVERNDDIDQGLLEQELWSLHKEIGDCEGAIANEIRWYTEGLQDSAKTITRLQGHYGRIGELSYKMGQASVHLEQVEERLSERDRAAAPSDLPEEAPAREDQLDWLRPVINSHYFEVERRDEIREPEQDLSRR